MGCKTVIRIFDDESHKRNLINITPIYEAVAPEGRFQPKHPGYTMHPLPVNGCARLGEDGKCEIYGDRPHVCQTFECGVLKKYKEGLITIEELLSMIERVKQGDKELFQTDFWNNRSSYAENDK